MANNVKVTIEGENKTKSAFGDVQKSMTGLQGAAGNLQTKALGPLNKMLGTGLKIAAGTAIGAIAGLTKVLYDGVGAAMDMEQQVADIASIMGLAKDETEPLSKLIQDLGIDPKLKVSAVEAADAIEMLGRNGLRMDDILNGAARSTVLLANATNADFSVAANVATDVMALFNIKADKMKDAVNGISSVAVNSKFDINDYALALAQAGGVASVVGVGFDDFNTTIAAISPYFASGSDAGTSFKTMLQRLIPASAPAVDAMRELGLFTGQTKDEFDATQAKIIKYNEELANLDPTSKKYAERSEELTTKLSILHSQLENGQNAFFNADGSMKDMAEIAGILNEATKNLSEEQKNNALSTIFGTDAMRAAAAMAGITEDEFLRLKGTMGNTDAEQMAATRMDTLSGVMEILWGVIDTLKLQIGDAFLPMLRRMAELFSEQATVQGPKLVAAFQALAAQLTVSLDKFLPWVEQAIPKMIAQIPGVVTGLINFGREALNVATQIYNAIAPVVRFVGGLTDLKGILTGVGVLIGVSVVAQVISFAAGIVGAVSSVIGFITALTGTGAALAAVVAAVGPVIAIVAAVGAAIYGLKVAWDNNLFGIRDKTKEVFDWLKVTFANLPQTLGNAKEAFYSWATGAMTRLKDGFEAGKNWARNALDVALDYIKSANFGDMGQRFYDWANSAMQRIKDGFEAGKNWARNALDVALDYIKGANFGDAGQRFYDGAKGIMNKVGEGFGAAREFAKGQLTQVLTDVQNQGAAFAAGAFAGRMYDSAKGAMLKFAEGLKTSNLGNDVKSVIDGVTNAVNGWAGGAGSHLYTKGRDVIWKLLEGLRSINVGADLWQNLNGIINTVNEWSNNAQKHLYIKASEIGRRLMEGLRDGISNMFGSVISKMNEVTNLLPQWLRDKLGIHSPSTVFMEIGTNIMAGLAQGLNDAMAMPQVAMTSAANSLTNISNNTSNSTVYNVNQQVTGGDGYDNLSMLSMLYTGA